MALSEADDLAVGRGDDDLVIAGDDEQEWLLSALADQAAIALEKTRLDETAAHDQRASSADQGDLWRLGA